MQSPSTKRILTHFVRSNWKEFESRKDDKIKILAGGSIKENPNFDTLNPLSFILII